MMQVCRQFNREEEEGRGKRMGREGRGKAERAQLRIRFFIYSQALTKGPPATQRSTTPHRNALTRVLLTSI